ncbi:MAG: sugar-specific transcriptional regulator TrmB [Methanolobus sp.]
MAEDSIEGQIRWIVSVDRRLVLMEYMKQHMIAKASEVAQETQRSTQNISHALKEFEDMGLVECLTPAKTTWKKYALTDTGKTVLEKMDGKYI